MFEEVDMANLWRKSRSRGTSRQSRGRHAIEAGGQVGTEAGSRVGAGAGRGCRRAVAGSCGAMVATRESETDVMAAWV